MTQPNVGTPDWQRGVISAQHLLATVAGGTDTVTVGVPPNAETIIVLAQTALLGTFSAVGVTSGFNYPFGVSKNALADSDQANTFFVNVANCVDDQLVISFSSISGTDWYVYADQAAHVTFDPFVGSAIYFPGNTPRYNGMLILGSDGTVTTAMETDSNGRQIPLVPTLSSGLVAVSANPTAVIAAPTSGAWYLMSADMTPNNGTSLGGVTLSTGSSVIAGVFGPQTNVGQLTVPADLKGYRTTSAVTASYINNANGFVVVRYAPGP